MSYSYRSNRSSAVNARRRPNTNKRKSFGSKPAKHIDPRRFVAQASGAQAETYIPTNTFSDFAIDSRLKANATAKGYHAPSPIQDQAIPLGLTGRDIIGLAGTGTGKTVAFALPVLQKLIQDRSAAALIIAPTRELAQQIEQECRALSQGSGIRTAVLIGGTGMGLQLRDLRQSPRLVIGTPGRTKDHLQRGTLKLGHFNMVVLDEVDRMLDMGFVHDVRDILQQLNPRRQCYFFSATMDERIRSLIDTFANEPTTIAIQTSSASENVHQDIVRYATNADKIDILHEILIRDNVQKAIVFEETKRNAERLSKELSDRGFAADAIHGGKSQGQRQRALTKFKKSEINVLVATDVAARGIDVIDITHVINYTTPKEYDDYIHRIGRTGRAGKIGHALTFVAH